MSDIRSILEERGKRYGSFESHADIAQDLKAVMRRYVEWNEMHTCHCEALEMMAHKIARILNGDPYYIDSWADIAGYAQLVVDSLERKQANDVRSQ